MHEWNALLENLEQTVGAEAFRRWVKPIRLLRFDAANLYLEAPDRFVYNWFQEHIAPSLSSFVNQNGRPIRIHLSLPIPPPSPSRCAPSLAPSLQTFLANPYPCQLLSELIRDKTTAFNPLLLTGPKGSGKSHLLQAVASALNVRYITAQTFTDEVVSAIRFGHIQAFRKNYRDLPLLILDDIDQLSGKAATQEEFFHTFNALHTAGRPLLFASRFSPSQMKEIEPRLISRFEWGLNLPLEKQDPVPILLAQAEKLHLSLSSELAELLARRFPSDPYKALAALALRKKPAVPLVASSLSQLLPDLLDQEKKQEVTPEKIIRLTAEHYRLRKEDLLGKSQTRECVLPRQIAIYLIRKHLDIPYQKIGQIFSRDHSTILSSIKKVEQNILNLPLAELESSLVC